jgi:hypothetical protein
MDWSCRRGRRGNAACHHYLDLTILIADHINSLLVMVLAACVRGAPPDGWVLLEGQGGGDKGCHHCLDLAIFIVDHSRPLLVVRLAASIGRASFDCAREDHRGWNACCHHRSNIILLSPILSCHHHLHPLLVVCLAACIGGASPQAWKGHGGGNRGADLTLLIVHYRHSLLVV